MALYNDIRTIIEAGKYDLSDMLHRIDVIYVSGGLHDTERTELYELARENADPEQSLGTALARIESIEEWRTSVDADILELRSKVFGEDPGPSDEWPEFVQPIGAHDAYHTGDKITWNGEHYICVAPEDVAVVWDPGTYPSYWQKDA